MSGKELVNKLQELWTRRQPIKAKWLEARQQLEKEAESLAKSQLDAIDAEAVNYLNSVSPEEYSTTRRAVICMEAAAEGLTPAEIIKIWAATYVSNKGGPVRLPPLNYYGKSWCRLGRGDAAKWAQKGDNGEYEVHEIGRWVLGWSYYDKKKTRDYRVYRIGPYLCADPV